MASTLGSLVEGVMDAMYGHVTQQDTWGALTQAIGTTDTTFTVDMGDPTVTITAGLIEIDSELMRVLKYDDNSSTVTIHPSGRGLRGTTAASHAVGAVVRVQPIMPYSSIVREVNAELGNLYPSICQTSTYEFTSNAVTPAYGLPADATTVLDVRYKDYWGAWQRVRRWETEFSENTTDFPTGIALRCFVPLPTTVHVVYGKPFGQFVNLTDTFASVGLPQSLEDVVRMGVMLRLLPTMDIAHLPTLTVSSAESGRATPQPGTGIMVARELKAQYKDRLNNEVTTFRMSYPARVHLTR